MRFYQRAVRSNFQHHVSIGERAITLIRQSRKVRGFQLRIQVRRIADAVVIEIVATDGMMDHRQRIAVHR